MRDPGIFKPKKFGCLRINLIGRRAGPGSEEQFALWKDKQTTPCLAKKLRGWISQPCIEFNPYPVTSPLHKAGALSRFSGARQVVYPPGHALRFVHLLILWRLAKDVPEGAITITNDYSHFIQVCHMDIYWAWVGYRQDFCPSCLPQLQSVSLCVRGDRGYHFQKL